MMRSDIFTVPTRTSILNTSSPTYFQTIVTADASVSTCGGEAAYSENMIQASIITAPSSNTPQYDLTNDLPTFCVGSPAKVEKGIGARAVNIYILKNLPYTVNIKINDNTVINKLPINVTAHKGIDSKNHSFQWQ